MEDARSTEKSLAKINGRHKVILSDFMAVDFEC